MSVNPGDEMFKGPEGASYNDKPVSEWTENDFEEYELDQNDPNWRGKKGGVTSTRAVSDEVPEPQRSFLTYAVEHQHGRDHQLKWSRMLIATGYKWQGVVGSQLTPIFQEASRLRPFTYEDCLEHYEANRRNARWSKAKKWFEDNTNVVPRDMEAEEREANAKRPGSPEYREAQLLKSITDDLPEWTIKEASVYFRGKDHWQFTGPWQTKKGKVWIDFELCDDGIERQIGKVVARFIKSRNGVRSIEVPDDIANAIEAGNWAKVAELAGKRGK